METFDHGCLQMNFTRVFRLLSILLYMLKENFEIYLVFFFCENDLKNVQAKKKWAEENLQEVCF